MWHLMAIYVPSTTYLGIMCEGAAAVGCILVHRAKEGWFCMPI